MPQGSVAALVPRPAFVFSLESADRVERDKILLSVAGFIDLSYFHISKIH